MAFSFRKFAAKAEVVRPFELAAVSEDQANPIVLMVRHAGDGNQGFANHQYKAVNKGRARSGQISADFVQARIADAADAFARHVIVDWRNVVEDGKPVPYSVDAAGRFLAALIHPTEGRSDVFMKLQSFCENADNFRDPVVDPIDLGKG